MTGLACAKGIADFLGQRIQFGPNFIRLAYDTAGDQLAGTFWRADGRPCPITVKRD